MAHVTKQSPQALAVYAGPRALAHLRERGLQPRDVRLVPAAAGGPKGLVLNPLDRYLFGHWFRDSAHTLHLVGASIGAWRMASACAPDADRALAEMAECYITQQYQHPGRRPPTAGHVSQVFGGILGRHLMGRSDAMLAHPTRRLHVVTSRGRHVLSRQGRLRTPLGYLGAAISNTLHRRALGLWLERVVFSDGRDALPLSWRDIPTRQVTLSGQNFVAAVLASCSIPFWLDAVHDIEGAPCGAYWDGGITDYHLHWNYAAMAEGLVLYPHFQAHVVPGWLDKFLPRRHGATEWLSNLVLVAPTAEWVAQLPRAKLPDRGDFKDFAGNDTDRMQWWRRAVAESQRLADEFAQWVEGGAKPELRPLP